MKTYPLAVVSLLLFGAPLTAFANDAPPSTPTNLSAQNYAGAGAEIFWQRSTDDQTVIGYDITINGQSIGIRDALSFYDGSIQEGAELTFTVTAVDNANQRSEPASFTLGGSSDSGSSNSAGSSSDADALSGLNIVRYSPTAAELFWDRSATPGLRYRIARDSEEIGVTDGTSFFDGNLSTDEPFHNYFVVAIDSNNNDVASQLIVLNAGASSGGTPMRPSRDPSENGDTDINDDSPEITDALSGLSIVRYSPTAAELFWERSATPGLRYRIDRDSEEIGVTDGTSFFDGNLSTDEPFHNYFVTAIDSNNNPLASQLIVLNAGANVGGTPMRPSRNPLAPASTDLIISEVLSVINTEALQEALLLTSLSFPAVENGFTVIDPESPSVITFACPTSGTVSLTREPIPTRQYNDCADGNTLFNGTYRRAGTSGLFLVNLNEFSVMSDDLLISIDEGLLEYRESNDGQQERRWTWTDTVFSNSTLNASIEANINNVTLTRSADDEFSAEVSAAVTVDGTSVTVSTSNTTLQSSNGDVFYTSGQIQIGDGDGISIVIDADGGDANSALITVTSDGSTESEIRTWSADFFVDCLSEPFPNNPTFSCN